MTFLYILLAIFSFGLLVVIHELGHFLMARLFGVGIHEFSVGMGPKILSKKSSKTGTDYSLRAFPIGGYVSMVGEDEESDAPDAFGAKKVWQRILIVVAGPVMNVLLGFLLMLILVLSTKQLASTTVAEFREGATSSSYGLEIGDRVLRVNGVRVHTGNELVYEIMNKGYAPVDLLVERDGEKVLVEGVVFPGLSEQGIAFGQPDFRVYAESRTFGHLLSHTYFRSVSTVKMIYDQLFDLLRGRFGLNAVSGPIGITEEMGNAARSGFPNFLYLLTVITVNLGVFNLLPLPALDGGRLFFLIFEAVARRPINRKVEGYIHLAGLALLMLLMIVVACKDVVGLIRK